jgi:hypothetical protein
LWVTVVGVMDGARLSLAGRVEVALAVLLALLLSGSSLRPGTADPPPAQPAVQATPQLPHGFLGGHAPLLRAAARHGQRSRHGDAPVAMPDAALAAAVVAATRGSLLARSRHLDGRRRLALGPRAPPVRS